jgi:S-methylmethionine-dependent homocysteine/selenocysteine methylase
MAQTLAVCPPSAAPAILGAGPVHADFDFAGLSQLVTASYRAAEPRLSESDRRAATALLAQMHSARLAAQAAEASDDAAALTTKIAEIQGDIDDLSKIITPRATSGQARAVAIRIATNPQN